MADLHFVDFALIPSPVRKEKQFRLRDDFSEFDFTVLLRTSHSAFGFHITDRPLFGDPRIDFTRRGRSKKFQHFRCQREKSSLTNRFNVKGDIIGGIKGFLASKASILSTVVKFLLLFTLLVLEIVVYLIRRIKITNLRFRFFA